jgi:hypothetical protein
MNMPTKKEFLEGIARVIDDKEGKYKNVGAKCLLCETVLTGEQFKKGFCPKCGYVGDNTAVTGLCLKDEIKKRLFPVS